MLENIDLSRILKILLLQLQCFHKTLEIETELKALHHSLDVFNWSIESEGVVDYGTFVDLVGMFDCLL